MSQKTLFSQWLQEEIQKRGWKQADLWHAAHLKRDAVSKLIHARLQPSPANIKAIASALDIPIEKVYRAAGLLPPVNEMEDDDETEQAIYLFRKIKDPQRRGMAVRLLRILAGQETDMKP